MCKAAAIILAGVVAFFFAWLCVFFVAGDVDVFTWEVKNRFLSLVTVLTATVYSIATCAIFYKK